MGDYPRISVLCPTRNRRRFIAGAIAGFMAQDYAGGAELIIIEDGDENCEDLAWRGMLGPHHCMRDGSSVRYFRFEGTIGAKLNFGARVATGEYCARFDDDDWQAPCRLRRQMELLQMSGRAVTACASGMYWTPGESEAFEHTSDPWCCSGFSHFFRRDWALSHPYPDTSLCEDAAFIQAAYEAQQLTVISGVDWMVARNHDAQTAKRGITNPIDREWLLTSDNWRRIPLERVLRIVNQ